MSKGKVCLAYSGGLDTSIILAWLLDQGYEVIAFLANVGQEEDFEAAREKALKIGATKFIVEDIRKEFVEQLCFPAVQANAIYENTYLLGTSLARPVIAKAQIQVAEREGCFAVSHGCTGKGNDQIRFEFAFYALKPDVKVIAPWRDPEFIQKFVGRKDLLDYAAEKGIPVTQTHAKPWSTDENLAHISYEAGILEDPDTTPPKEMWKLTTDPTEAPDTPQDFTLFFDKGIPSKLVYDGGNKTVTEPLELFLTLNKIGQNHGVGRIDIVENRYLGLKSRGCYESSAITILRAAHIDCEALCADRDLIAWRDVSITPAFSKCLYNGYYYSQLGEALRKSIPATQENVNGQVRCRVYKGSVSILGRSSETEKLYDASMASMDELTDYDPTDATGFIAINAIRLKKYGQAKRDKGEAL